MKGIFRGENFDKTTPHGFYYLTTNEKQPYAMGTSPILKFIKKSKRGN